MLTGENGILTQATKAGEETARAEAEEKVTLAILGSYDNTGKVNEKTIYFNVGHFRKLIFRI